MGRQRHQWRISQLGRQTIRIKILGFVLNNQTKILEPKHLLVAISSHGFGHLSQVAPAVIALKQLLPNIKITVRGAFDSARIKARIPCVDVIDATSDDIGMVMQDAVTIDTQASVAALQVFHQDWAHKVEQLAQYLIRTKVSLVLADVPYLTLAAAQRAHIPAVALSSLNWADIFADSLGAAVEPALLQQIRAYYQYPKYFLQCAPTMPMTWLNNRKLIGPVCSPGIRRRHTIIDKARLEANSWLVLVGMGGVPLDLTMTHWPTHIASRNVHYLVNKELCGSHPNTLDAEALGFAYGDLITSADLVITKPGYGMFAEVACSGVPAIYVERKDWPETKALTDWLHAVGHCQSVTYAQLKDGSFVQAMADLLQQGKYPAVLASGNQEAAKLLFELLNGPLDLQASET